MMVKYSIVEAGHTLCLLNVKDMGLMSVENMIMETIDGWK